MFVETRMSLDEIQRRIEAVTILGHEGSRAQIRLVQLAIFDLHPLFDCPSLTRRPQQLTVA